MTVHKSTIEIQNFVGSSRGLVCRLTVKSAPGQRFVRVLKCRGDTPCAKAERVSLQRFTSRRYLSIRSASYKKRIVNLRVRVQRIARK